ncbi:hypothetical protein [Sunxiuqinia dokdonensis]|nr:hypothetical protein [Sunxiuqinia dokdonensis]
MSKNRKPKKKTAPSQNGGYKQFLRDMRQMLVLVDLEDSFLEMNTQDKREMYKCAIGVRNPESANAYVTPKELKLITARLKTYYRTYSPDPRKYTLSTYQLMLFYCFNEAEFRRAKRLMKDDKHPDVVCQKHFSTQSIDTFYSYFKLQYFRLITQLSKPDQKYFSVRVRPAPVTKFTKRVDLISEVYGSPAHVRMFVLNGHKRPAFRLGQPSTIKPVEWISVDASVLGSAYSGTRPQLEVYIQSHALRRMRERLDLLDEGAVNYALWENTHTITKLEHYNRYLLLPFKVFDVKIGYLVASVVQNKVLFRTFLFVTHNCTPEGDRLQKLTGLEKHDVTYWRIDRLSTFVKLDEEKYPDLIRLFDEAGLGDLVHLKEKNFDIDALQEANLNGLAEYLKRSQSSPEVEEQEWEAALNEMI